MDEQVSEEPKVPTVEERLDVLEGNVQYLHDWLMSFSKDHETMAENCNKIAPFSALMQNFLDTYGPILSQLTVENLEKEKDKFPKIQTWN